VDNQVYQQENSVYTDPTPASISASSSQSAPQMSDEDKAAEQIHKLVAPFPNRLRKNNKNMHMEKMLEMFNQVKLNVPLLDAIQQVPAYAKFLKDMCTKKRKINVPKIVFLATNISEILSGPIPVKYKDPGCPTISGTIGQTEISRALLLELAFDDTFVKTYQWSSFAQAYSRVLHDQDFPKRMTMDVYCNI